MGFIEQAVELVKRPGVDVAATQGRDVGRLIDQDVDHRASPPAPEGLVGTPPPAISVMPCRTDRTLSIDVHALQEGGLLAPELDRRQLAEEYRIVKRPLLAGMKGGSPGRHANIIVVCSALPGEGKTFTCVNLALSMAREREREVLLIDGDVAKPHISHLFGLEREPGLLDVVGGKDRRVDEAILRTDIPSLFVLPAGTQSSQATEILRSNRMSSLLAELATEPRRIVLIDSPPLLVTSEAGVLTSLADQVVLVVKAAHTPQEAVLHAIETIAEDKSVGLVLNQADAVPERRYAYYGRYGYGRDPDQTAEVGSTPNRE